MIIPGVQKPHWRPCSSQNAFCRGCSVDPLARPSIVVTWAPSAWTAKTVQDFTLWPSSSTVHAPQLLVSHPTCVPVSPATSRMYCTSSNRGSTSCSCLVPLMVTATLRLIATSLISRSACQRRYSTRVAECLVDGVRKQCRQWPERSRIAHSTGRENHAPIDAAGRHRHDSGPCRSGVGRRKTPGWGGAQLRPAVGRDLP